jgi:hypothetical protein
MGGELWVTSSEPNQVTRLHLGGKELGVYPVAGAGAAAITFASASVWVVNAASNTIVRLDLDGKRQGTNDVTPNQPRAIVNAAGRLYVAVANVGILSLGPANETLGVYSLGGDLRAITVGDGTVWASDPSAARIVGVRIDDESTVTHTIGGPGLRGIAAGKGLVWVASSVNNQLYEHDPNAGGAHYRARYPVGSDPEAVAFDVDRVFVANRGESTVSIVGV